MNYYNADKEIRKTVSMGCLSVVIFTGALGGLAYNLVARPLISQYGQTEQHETLIEDNLEAKTTQPAGSENLYHDVLVGGLSSLAFVGYLSIIREE